MTTLAQYSAARAALAEAARVDQVMHIRDEVEHLQLYARQIKNRTLMADALELQLRCERRLGQLLVAAKEGGQVSRGAPKKNCTGEEQFSRVRLEDAGIDRKLSSKAQKAAKLSEKAFAAMIEQARNRVAGAAARPVNKVKAIAKKQEPAPVHRPSDLQEHGTPPRWRSEFERIWRAPPRLADRKWAIDLIAGDLTMKERRRLLFGVPMSEVDPVTGEILDDSAEGEGNAEQSSSKAMSSQQFKSGLPQQGGGSAASPPQAPTASPDLIPDLPPFLDRRLST